MGHWFSIDVTDLHMFSGCEWREFGEPCNHACEHRSTSVIGWGPTLATYELEECRDCGCRAWRDGRWVKARQRDQDSGFWHGRMVWAVPVVVAPEDPK